MPESLTITRDLVLRDINRLLRVVGLGDVDSIIEELINTPIRVRAGGQSFIGAIAALMPKVSEKPLSLYAFSTPILITTEFFNTVRPFREANTELLRELNPPIARYGFKNVIGEDVVVEVDFSHYGPRARNALALWAGTGACFVGDTPPEAPITCLDEYDLFGVEYDSEEPQQGIEESLLSDYVELLNNLLLLVFNNPARIGDVLRTAETPILKATLERIRSLLL